MEGVGGIKAAAYLASSIAPELTHDLDAAWWSGESEAQYVNGRVSFT